MYGSVVAVNSKVPPEEIATNGARRMLGIYSIENNPRGDKAK
tara:strand:+ start:214 stop:339 length:126 start_codon:yes stop_codon:yes gene_type:complete